MQRKMKFNKIIITAVALFSALTSSAQFRDGAYADLYDSETVSAVKAHVRELSSAVYEGRKAGSEGERMAAQYVEDHLKSYGVDVISVKGGDKFGIKQTNGDTLSSRNVIGFVQGYDKDLRDRFIVVGARLDNIGTQVMTVDGQPAEKVFYGANGNASGLSMLIELARKVEMTSPIFRRSILFVAFGSSCETFAGSWYFLNRSFADAGKIDAMINLDMLGTGYNGFYAYTSSNADMNSLLRTLEGELLPVKPQIVSTEPYASDHRAFYAKEIPSVMFTTGKYSEYNTVKDTQSILDYDMMERELEYIYNFTKALSNQDHAPLFYPGKMPVKKSLSGVVSFYDCDQKPMFMNSSDPRKFMDQWVYKMLKYPASAIRDGVQGRVMVEFIIEKDGKLTEAKVVKGVSEELDAEALKVVAASPKWKPGKVGKEKVRCSMTLPVEFRLKKKGRK